MTEEQRYHDGAASKNGAGKTGLPSEKQKEPGTDSTLKINSKWTMDPKENAKLLEDNIENLDDLGCDYNSLDTTPKT